MTRKMYLSDYIVTIVLETYLAVQHRYVTAAPRFSTHIFITTTIFKVAESASQIYQFRDVVSHTYAKAIWDFVSWALYGDKCYKIFINSLEPRNMVISEV